MIIFMKLVTLFMLAFAALASADPTEERRSNLRADPVETEEVYEAKRPDSRGLWWWNSPASTSRGWWNPYAAALCHPIHCPVFSYPNAHDGCTDHIGECMCFHGYYMEHGRCVRRH